MPEDARPRWAVLLDALLEMLEREEKETGTAATVPTTAKSEHPSRAKNGGVQ